MRKKLDIAEKLKKLSEELNKLSEGKKDKTPILKPKKAREIKEVVKKEEVEEPKERLYKVEEKEAKIEELEESVAKEDEQIAELEELSKVKSKDIEEKDEKIGELEELAQSRARDVEEKEEEPPTRVTKPPIQLRPLSIKDLAIPASAYELFSIEIVLDSSEKKKVMQLLSLRENPEVKLKWTVFRDPHMREFDWLKREGLVQIRDDPPIYAHEFDEEGTLVVSHIGDYTFSMASYDLKTEDLVKHFIFGLNNARKYDLKVKV